MNNTIKIAAFQTNIYWEDKEKNMHHAEKLLAGLTGKTDLVVFPEMFLTGFSMNVANIAEPMSGKMVEWMKDIARNMQCALMGSLPIVSDNKYFNRLLVVSPDNKIIWYDKRHLFRMGEEPKHYTSGSKNLIFNHRGFNIKPLVCYDLRFPVWSRNKNLEYDLLIYVANWPAARNDAFLSLLKARAIENQSYVLGVNCIGKDGNGVQYNGNSVVFDALGKNLNNMVQDTENVINIDLGLPKLSQFRQKFPAYLDADNFEIINPKN